MTIDEAVMYLSEQRAAKEWSGPKCYEEALGLGIEALKVVKEFRTGRYKTVNSPLPGESQE